MTEPEAVDLGDDVAGWLDVWHSLTAKIKGLEEQKTAVRERLEAALGDASEGKVAGRVAVRRTRVESVRVDVKALRKGAPEVAEMYSTRSASYRFTVVEE